MARPPLRRPNSSSHPLCGGCLTVASAPPPKSRVRCTSHIARAPHLRTFPWRQEDGREFQGCAFSDCAGANGVHLQERIVLRRRIAQRPTVFRGERAPDAADGGSAPRRGAAELRLRALTLRVARARSGPRFAVRDRVPFHRRGVRCTSKYHACTAGVSRLRI
jgi:hypothetical protein